MSERIFIAVNFDKDTKEFISSVQDQLKSISECGTFSRQENFHLTVMFIGDVEKNELNMICDAVESIDSPSNEFVISGIGRFRREGGDIWWLGVKKYDELEKIHLFIADKLRQAGFELEKRTFKPHLTIARECIVRSNASVPTYQPMEVKVDRISVMRSERIRGRLTYTELYRKDLG